MRGYLLILCFLLSSVLFFSCNEKSENLKNEKSEIIDSLMFKVVFKGYKNDNKLNLISKSLSYSSKEVSVIIDSISYFSNRDKEELKSRIDTCEAFFNCKNLSFVNCIIDETELDSLLSIESKLIKEGGIYLVQDPWNEVRKRYGNGGIHRYSLPLWNNDTTAFVVKHLGIGDLNIGSCEYFIFVKNNKGWHLKETKNLYIF